MKYSLKKLLLVTAGAALAIWFVRSMYVVLTQIETRENVPSVDWLPDTASNVSYYRSYLNTAYEFDISESGFRSWSRWDVTEISEPVTIERYSQLSKCPEPNATDEEWEAYFMADSERSATIDDGLYYGYRQDDFGGVWVAYDRKRGRAFFQSAHR